MNIYEELGLRKVINADGKMTALGATAVRPEIAAAVERALQDYVVISELIDAVGGIIAQKTGAEAGLPVNGASAGIVISIAGLIARDNIRDIERIPLSDGLKNEIVIQKGHVVHFGGNIAQMIALGGGRLVEAGCVNAVGVEHIEASITDRTAALFYVKSHHTVQKGMQPISTVLDIAKRHNLPVVMDAAAEEDLRKYVAQGVDLVIYSGGKALGGPTCGLVCGKKNLIEYCKKQYLGVGRALKVSKEAMIGLATALKHYQPPQEEDIDRQKAEMEALCRELNSVEGLSASVQQDEAGRKIFRATLSVDATRTKISARDLKKKLQSGNPAIYLRGHYAESGTLAIDPRPMKPGDAQLVLDSIERCVREAQNG